MMRAPANVTIEGGRAELTSEPVVWRGVVPVDIDSVAVLDNRGAVLYYAPLTERRRIGPQDSFHLNSLSIGF